jgi:GTP-binding protein Era
MMEETSDRHRFGFATLAGAPNVGKSTLLNRIIGQKISIISRRPQTTRHRILGVKTLADSQIVFVDTPGLHTDQKKSLNRVINRTSISSLSDVDLILFMIDYKGWSSSLIEIFDSVRTKNVPVMLLINKVDRLKDKSRLLPLMEESRKIHGFLEIVPVSALKMNDIDDFLHIVASHLPKGPAGFPADQITDRSQKFLASELVREQTFSCLGQELPYSIATEVTKFEMNENEILCIDVVIWVEKAGQKSIVIGKDGQQLKTIGMNARKQMQRSFGKKVFLNLWVKVKKGWADRTALLHSLGYTEH